APLSPLAMAQQFTAQVVAPDLKKVQAILDLLPQSASPAATPAAQGPPRVIQLAAADKKSALAAAAGAATQPAPPPPPAKLIGGSLTLAMDATGQGND